MVAVMVLVDEIRLNMERRDSPMPSTRWKKISEKILDISGKYITEFDTTFEQCSDMVIGDIKTLFDEFNSNEDEYFYAVVNDYCTIRFEDGHIVSDLSDVTIDNLPFILYNIPTNFFEEHEKVELVIIEVAIIIKGQPLLVLPPGSLPPPKKSKRK